METRRMKVFQTTKVSLASIDLDPNKHLLHESQLLHVLEGFLAILLQFAYLFCVASTTSEYMNSIYMTTFGSLIYICYWSAILQTETIFALMDDLENAVNERELPYL